MKLKASTMAWKIIHVTSSTLCVCVCAIAVHKISNVTNGARSVRAFAITRAYGSCISTVVAMRRAPCVCKCDGSADWCSNVTTATRTTK